MIGLARDLRFALRQVFSRPGFSATVILTLAAAIGANTAAFSAVNHVLLHPLAAPGLGQLVFIHENIPGRGFIDADLDPGQTFALIQRRDLFSGVAGTFIGSHAVVRVGGEARAFNGARVIGDLFNLFDVRPVTGRFFRPEDSNPDETRRLVLSYDMWRELGGSPSLVGHTLNVGTTPFEVVGVAPPGFNYPRDARFWQPFPNTENMRTVRLRLAMVTIARPRPGVSPAQLRGELAREAARLHPELTATEQFLSTRPFLQEYGGSLGRVLWIIQAAVLFTLLIACANVTSLHLMRGIARTRELAIRSALGAGRGALVRQVVMEQLMYAAAAGVIGVGIAAVMLGVLTATGGAHLPLLRDVSIDGYVLAFAVGISAFCGIAAGLLLSIRSGRANVAASLVDGGRGSAGMEKNRALRTLVALQVALALVLLAGSALMVRTMRALLSDETGFNSTDLRTLQVSAVSGMDQTTFFPLLNERLRQLPGVRSVGMVTDLPFGAIPDLGFFSVRGRDDAVPSRSSMEAVTGDYFQTMGIPLRAGRTFSPSDAANAPAVVVVDEQLARQAFPGESAVGRQLQIGTETPTIVGVVGGVRRVELGEARTTATIYYPYAQRSFSSALFVAARSRQSSAAVLSAVRAVATSLEPTVLVDNAGVLETRMARSLAPRRLTMSVFLWLSGVSLLLAVIGVFGVMSYGVQQRRRDIGIRLALGAQHEEILMMVLRQAVVLVGAGTLCGIALAAALSRGLQHLLYAVRPSDPIALGVVTAIVALTTLLAAYRAASQTARISAVEVLRSA